MYMYKESVHDIIKPSNMLVLIQLISLEEIIKFYMVVSSLFFISFSLTFYTLCSNPPTPQYLF